MVGVQQVSRFLIKPPLPCLSGYLYRICPFDPILLTESRPTTLTCTFVGSPRRRISRELHTGTVISGFNLDGLTVRKWDRNVQSNKRRIYYAGAHASQASVFQCWTTCRSRTDGQHMQRDRAREKKQVEHIGRLLERSSLESINNRASTIDQFMRSVGIEYPRALFWSGFETRRLEHDSPYYTRLTATIYHGPLVGISLYLPESAQADP